ncbi:hypothetical protein AB1K83_03655 [Sporosarcina sp. 179-K 3D1 HS]
MNIKRVARAIVGANVMLLMTFAFLPALVFNADIDFLQSFMKYLNND